MKKPENESAEAVLRRFDELHSKYKFMEYNLNTKKTRQVSNGQNFACQGVHQPLLL